MPRIIKAAEAVQDFHCGTASSLRHSIVIAAQHRHCGLDPQSSRGVTLDPGC
jgi:hypothetical protein